MNPLACPVKSAARIAVFLGLAGALSACEPEKSVSDPPAAPPEAAETLKPAVVQAEAAQELAEPQAAETAGASGTAALSAEVAIEPNPQQPNPQADAAPKAFDLQSIPISDQDLGAFPYFSAPQGFQYINGGGKQKDFELSQVAIDGKLVGIEGPWFGAFVTAQSATPWSQHFVEKSYDEIITSLGGVRISRAPVETAEVDRVAAAKQLLGSEGAFDYWNKGPIATYVVRRANGAAVYIQLQTNSASGRLQVAQQGEFKQTIQLVKASDLKKSIDANGRAVVHVNFDIDRATVQADGMRAVAEIVSLMQSEPALRLSVEGHTDNSGSSAHNLLLSQQRAATVQQLLQLAGVSADRLKTTGLGDTQPIAKNTSEDNKAQNRRVELVKF